MSKFDKAFEITIGHEGGYVFDKDDKGGETKYGISKRSYPHLNIKDLTLDEAKKIYFTDFWNTPRMNLDLLDESIAIELFDTGVNMGIGSARKMLQKALNVLNRNEKLFDDLKVDGWIGTSSLNAVAKTKTRELLKTLNGLQFMRYYKYANKNKKQERFFGGWVMRT